MESIKSMEYIKSILSKFIKDESVISKIVTPKTISYWERAVTHESVNYNEKENYEKLEFLGDGLLGYAFTTYLHDYVGIKDRAVINNLLSHYLSKSYQPTMCKKMGIDKLIRVFPGIKIEDYILEDVFEAFFGAIEQLLRQLYLSSTPRYKKPSDYTIDFFIWYFSNIDTIDMKNGEIPVKNFFDGYYHFMSREATQKKYKYGYNPITKSFDYTPQFLKSIKMYSEKLYEEFLPVINKKGGSSGYTNEDIYLKKMYDILTNNGYDLVWLDEEKKKTTFTNEMDEILKEHSSMSGMKFRDILKESGGYARAMLLRNEKQSYDLVLQSVHPRTKESITEVIKRFDMENFNDVKEESIKILIEKFKIK